MLYPPGRSLHVPPSLRARLPVLDQDSSKGGAVETGCSGLHYIIGCFIIYFYPHPLHTPPTAPPFDEYPLDPTPSNVKLDKFGSLFLNVATYELHTALSLFTGIYLYIIFIQSDFWRWGLSARPLYIYIYIYMLIRMFVQFARAPGHPKRGSVLIRSILFRLLTIILILYILFYLIFYFNIFFII